MRIALLLSTAFVTTRRDHPGRDRRVQQYVSGLQQIAQVVASYPCFDVFSMDNTVDRPETIDSRVTAALDKIPALKGKYHFWDNELGKINKGSGLILQWNRILPDLSGSYEYVVHYEPRQRLVSFAFFERMAHYPDAYFCVYRDKYKLYGIIPLRALRFWTGMFSMRLADLWDYVRAGDRGVPASLQHHRGERFYRRVRRHLLPGWVAGLEECIEADFPRYVRRHKIPIVRVPALGARWHEEADDQWVDMVDRDFEL